MKLEIDSYWELLALHKSIMDVKFNPETKFRPAQGSPYTGSLAFKVFNLLVEASVAEGKQKQADDWLSWQVADRNRNETELLLEHITESKWWESANFQEREKYVVDFMAPLKLVADIQNEIINTQLTNR